jgi:hypothetical protein
LGIFFALKFAGVSATDAGATELGLQGNCQTKFRGGHGLFIRVVFAKLNLQSGLQGEKK